MENPAIKTPIWKANIVRVLFFCLICVVILMVGAALTKGLLKPWGDMVLALSAAAAIFGLNVVFAQWEKMKLTDIGILPGKTTLPKMLVGVLIGLVLAVLHALLLFANGNIILVEEPQFNAGALLTVLALYTVLALREELAFRAYPLRSLANSIGPLMAQLLIAVVFALEHVAGGYTWTQAFLGAAVGAILFGIAALKTNGIALPVGLHMAWNFGQWCLGLKNEPGIWRAAVNSDSRHEEMSMLFYLVVMGIAILAFYLYKPRAVTQKTL